ncbi:MAG: hypothetical protein NTZ35_05530 [Ignavibacteriales bacterium]|nr:hypothetical protein [Ignavibacteriales bacterium]
MKNSKNIPATVQSLLAKKLQSAVRTFSVLTILRARRNRVGVGRKLPTPTRNSAR